MPKPRNIIPSRQIKISIPETEAARLDLLLYAEGEGRVPQGSYREFLLKAIREAWEFRALDLSPFCGSPPGAFLVRAEEPVIRALEKTLKGE